MTREEAARWLAHGLVESAIRASWDNFEVQDALLALTAQPASTEAQPLPAAVPMVDVEKAANALYLSRKSIAEASSFEVLHPHMRELYRKDARAILSAGYVGSVSVDQLCDKCAARIKRHDK